MNRSHSLIILVICFFQDCFIGGSGTTLLCSDHHCDVGSTSDDTTTLLQVSSFENRRSTGKKQATLDLRDNIYGEPLQTCDPSGAAAGSSSSDGTCDEKTGGIHSLCISSLPGDFSKETGQTPWSEEEAGRPWCVCIGAWSLYHAEGHNAQAHCDAIPSFVLQEEYINNWSTWNGLELDDQIIDGINELYNQCSAGKSGSALATLNNNYCRIALHYTGKFRHFETSSEFSAAGCR